MTAEKLSTLHRSPILPSRITFVRPFQLVPIRVFSRIEIFPTFPLIPGFKLLTPVKHVFEKTNPMEPNVYVEI